MEERTCTWIGCDRSDILARGLCQRCYKRAMRDGSTRQYSVTVKVCDVCHAEFAAGKHGGRYCSQPCRDIGWLRKLATRREERVAAKIGRQCEACGHIMPTFIRSDAIYCGPECQQAAWYARDADRLRIASRIWARANPESRKDAEHRRQARKFGTDAESVDRKQIWVRDNGRCGLCSEEVDPALRRPDPMSGSLDHIVPLSRGGAHRASNIQLTHLVCNLRKGVKTAPIEAVV